MKEIYPVTIFMSRYGGTYEGASWIAVNASAYECVVSDFLGDDETCYSAFDKVDKGSVKNEFGDTIRIGRGGNPSEAFDSLRITLDKVDV